MTHQSDLKNLFGRRCLQILLGVSFIALNAVPICAQTFKFSDGTTARCTTFSGQIAQQIYLPLGSGMFMNMGYTGTTIALPDGSARITWDTDKLNSLPTEAHDFIYFHECAHAHVPTSDELMANCVGLIDMRAAGRSSAAIEEKLSQFHASLGFMGPRYGYGPDYWARTLQCAASGGPKTQYTPAASTTTTCSFNYGPKAGQIINFANRPGVVPAMVGSPCTDGAGSYGVAVPSSASAASNGIEGDWQGILRQWNLPIVLHLAAGGIGNADSPSQNSYGIPLRYTISGNRLNVVIPSVGATYNTLVGGSQMIGNFSQRGQNVPLVLLKTGAAEPGTTASSNWMVGNWRGVLVQFNLPIILHLDANGRGTADSPSQNAFGMPLRYTVNGNRLSISIAAAGATYVATSNGSGQMSGPFTQNGHSVSLTLSKF